MKERTETLLILVVLLICSFFPVFAASPFSQQDSSLVIKEVLMKTSVAYLWLSPIVHVVTVVLLVALYLYGSRVGRIVDVFFAILFLFIAFSNHIAVTDTYGLARARESNTVSTSRGRQVMAKSTDRTGEEH
jgi:hypothetical protein